MLGVGDRGFFELCKVIGAVLSGELGGRKRGGSRE